MAHSTYKVQRSMKRINRRYRDTFKELRVLERIPVCNIRGRHSEKFNRLDGIVVVLCLAAAIVGLLRVL